MAALAAGLFTACVFGPRQPDDRDALSVAVGRPFSVDPVSLRDQAGILIARQLYEPLVRVDPESSALIPGLARSWEVLDGGTRFLFRLTPEAKFHTGRDVKAEDVRFSLNRLARKSTVSETAFLLDSIVGFEAVNVTGDSQELAGVSVVDDLTLEIRLAAPWFDFPYVLSNPATSPVPKSDLEANPAGFAERPIGNGPYQLTGPIRSGQDITVRRFSGYRGPRAAVSGVRFLLYDNEDSAWGDFEDGRIDIARAPTGRIALAEAKYGSAGFSPLAAGLYIAFNLRNDKFSDPRLRRAISLAINRETISRSIYAGALVSAHGIVPPGVPGGGQPVCGPNCTRNAADAATLLAEEHPGGGAPEVFYDFPAGVADEAVAGSLQANLGEVGIKLTPRPRERELHAFLDLLQTRQHEMFRLAWPAEYPLADWFLNPLFRSGSPDNHTGFASKEIDGLLATARATQDPSQRMAMYADIERRVIADLSVVPIGFFQNHYVAGERVEGFYADALGGFDIGRFQLNAP